jgi:hypothetical protein
MLVARRLVDVDRYPSADASADASIGFDAGAKVDEDGVGAIGCSHVHMFASG